MKQFCYRSSNFSELVSKRRFQFFLSSMGHVTVVKLTGMQLVEANSMCPISPTFSVSFEDVLSSKCKREKGHAGWLSVAIFFAFSGSFRPLLLPPNALKTFSSWLNGDQPIFHTQMSKPFVNTLNEICQALRWSSEELTSKISYSRKVVSVPLDLNSEFNFEEMT